MNTMKDIKQIKRVLARAGAYASAHSHRLTSHPGQFNVLPSPKANVVERCIVDLTIHGTIFDWMGVSRTPYNKINIHLGGAYGDKEASMKRFVKNFPRLPESVSSRLTLENDDKASMYSVKDLYYGIYKKVGVPIVFDYHHHQFCTGGMSEQEALEIAVSEYRSDRKFLVLTKREWHPGIIGIVAARIAEKFNLPTALVARANDGNFRGSIRSNNKLMVNQALAECDDLLIAHGGRSAAAGIAAYFAGTALRA